jgi:Ni/Co efflux regulator RcnB
VFALPTISRALTRIARTAGVLLLAGLVAGGPAAAEGRGHGREGRIEGRGDGPREGRREGRWERGSGEWRGGPPRRYREAPPIDDYGPPRGYGYGPYNGAPVYSRRPVPPGFGLRRGGMIPPEYRGAVVPDYGRHRLRPPPPGFAWVRMGDRYLLVSRQTGQIFDVIGD